MPVVLVALGGVLVGCAPAPPPPPSPARPSVVLVTLDTTRADRLGCYGYAAAETPNLDALAARGARFSRAYAAIPLTIPSHGSLFTGLWPPHHGVRDNGDARLDPEATTLAERLQAAGWRTGAATSAFVTQAHWGFGQGFDRYDDDLGVASDQLSWRSERPAGEVIEAALAQLDDRVTFLWVHLFEPHAPYQPPEPFRTRHEGRPYDGEIAAADAALGRLLQRLPVDALVVVAGDHGEGLGEGGEQNHGLLLGDATLRVPLILAGPGVAPQVIDTPVSLVDVLPTLLGLLDLPPEPGLDGTDLFAPAPRAGVYAETRYGAMHYGWAPMAAVIGAGGRVVRGARDEEEGEVGAAMRADLEHLVAETPRWEATPLTLDLAEVEQLQALGYLGGVEVGEVEGAAVDPRDGIRDLPGLAELGQKPPAEQESFLRDLLQRQPNFRDARFRLALLLAHTGRAEEGLGLLGDLARRSPDSTAAVAAGDLSMQLGQAEDALSWYREALSFDPRSPSARAGEIEAMIALGLREDAQAQAQLLLAESPDDTRALMARAWLALEGGEPVEPWMAPLDALADRRPWQPRLLALCAHVHAAAGDPDRALELYREALRQNPWDIPTRLAALEQYRAQGLLVDALKTLRPLRAVQPDEPAWRDLEAELYREMGREPPQNEAQ
ncbi:MAG: sulfatase-like hydrolase/transferase [Pseudomonadota bacterium]